MVELPERYRIWLEVAGGQPAGVEGIPGVAYEGGGQDFTGWTWVRAGGTLCTITDPDGAKWGFEPSKRTYWVRADFPGIDHLEGEMQLIPDLAEWERFAGFHAWLDQKRKEAEFLGPPAQVDQLFLLMASAATAGYQAILIGECPLVASTWSLYIDANLGVPLCSKHLTGNPDGSINTSPGPIFWQCHLRKDHPGDCDAAMAVANRCCTPSIMPSWSDPSRGDHYFAWPYPRSDFWMTAAREGLSHNIMAIART